MCPWRYPAVLRSWRYRVREVRRSLSGGVFPIGNRRDIALLCVFRRFSGVWLFRNVFNRAFCSVRSAASVWQIDSAPLSCVYLGTVHGLRWDAVQPAGAAETVTADICAAGRSKIRHTAHIARNDGMKIARIAPGFSYLCVPASDDRTEKIRINGNNMLIFSSPPSWRYSRF